MADVTNTGRTTTHTEPTDLLPDVAGVKSRVSWPAILGGALVAIASFLVLTLLFAAIGITAAERGVGADNDNSGYGTFATIAGIASIAISLFVGGYISSQLTVGENRQEAVIYGILTWAVVTGISLYMVGMGVRAGYLAALGGATVAQNSQSMPSLEEVARKAGMKQEDIDAMKAKANPDNLKAQLNDPKNQEAASKAAVRTSWTALVGTLLSMAAAIGGALAGVGTQFRLFPAEAYGRRTTTGTTLPRTSI